jgi:hypothetical protein
MSTPRWWRESGFVSGSREGDPTILTGMKFVCGTAKRLRAIEMTAKEPNIGKATKEGRGKNDLVDRRGSGA